MMRPSAVRTGVYGRVTALAVLIALVAMVMLLASCGAGEMKPSERKIMIIGVDGLEWDIMGPMLEAGRLPNFARVLGEGAWGEIRSLDVLESPVIWTSIATGKTPEKHGITGFAKQPHAGAEPVPMTSNVRRVKALWNILGERGIPVGVIGWLATWPAEEVNGYLVSSYFNYGWRPGADGERSRYTWPEELAGELSEVRLTADDISDERIRPFLTDDPGDTKGEQARLRSLKTAIATDETVRRAALRLYEERPTSFFAIYLRGVDGPSHQFWVDAFPESWPEGTEPGTEYLTDVVERYYVYMDEVVGEFIALADDRTTVVLTSDHGHSGPKNRGGVYHWGIAMHDPTGVIALWGRDIVPGTQLDSPGVLDVTPTLLTLMGLPVADDMDGRVLTEAIEPAFLERYPVTTILSYEEGVTADESEPIESPVDDEVRERLRSLGYIE